MMGPLVVAGMAWATFPREVAYEFAVRVTDAGAMILLTAGNLTVPIPIGPEDAAGLLGALNVVVTPPANPDLAETATG